MALQSQIQFSTDYSAFKFYDCNRQISHSHVQNLIDDPTFKNKYRTSPIIVSPGLSIIDGQHRFKACEKLNLPVHFIIDPSGSEEDVKIRNTNQKSWKTENFIEFYSHSNEDYKLLKELRERHLCSLTVISAALNKICGYRNREYHYALKHGNLCIKKNREKLIEFLDLYVPMAKKATQIKGKLNTRAYFTDAVVVGFAHHFLVNRRVFDKAIKKMCTTSYEFPFCKSYESSRTAVEKLANYAERKVSLD